MPVQGVEGRTAHLPAVDHVEVAFVVLNVGETLIPAGLLDPAQLAALDDGDSSYRIRILTEHIARGQLGEGRRHHGGQQLIPQARGMCRPTLLGYPRQEAGAVPLGAMARGGTCRRG
jgi:hypothetical protein